MEKFFWGNSTSSMQTEGGWDEHGKSLSVYDIRPATEQLSDWHVANDNFHHLTEDLDLMQDLGMNMYRFQISWSRIIKDGDGEVNEAGFAYYDKLVNGLLKRNIEPMICLYHFDMPLHLAQAYNGFINKKVVAAFIRFSKIVIDHYKDRVKYWLTFNEQNLYSQDLAFEISGYLTGQKTTSELYQITHNVMYAHATITNYLHKTTNAKIGGMLAYVQVYPATPNPNDVLLAHQYDEFMNINLFDAFATGQYSKQFLTFIKNYHLKVEMTTSELAEIAKMHSDYLAFSYYSSTTLDSSIIPVDTIPNYYLVKGSKNNPYLRQNEWKWQIDPIGFRDALNKIYQRYHIPVFPIENGIGLDENWDGVHEISDDVRIDYMRNHILNLQKAMQLDGVEVLGYLGWGLIDILSSSGNMHKRYGVVYVNRTNHDLKDMKRVPKKSYYWLKQVIKSNGQYL